MFKEASKSKETSIRLTNQVSSCCSFFASRSADLSRQQRHRRSDEGDALLAMSVEGDEEGKNGWLILSPPLTCLLIRCAVEC